MGRECYLAKQEGVVERVTWGIQYRTNLRQMKKKKVRGERRLIELKLYVGLVLG